MKKMKILSVFMMLGLTVSAQTVSVDNVTLGANETSTVNIKLSGGSAFVATGFMVELPDGFTFTGDVTRGTDSHVTRTYLLNDQKTKVVIYSSQNMAFDAGTIDLMGLKVKAGNKTGTFQGKITGLEFASNSLSLSKKADVTFDINVEASVVLGDVNGDKSVTPADAIMILYHYFGVTQTGFIEAAANVNGDGNISPADAIEVLYMYFGAGGNTGSNNTRSYRPIQADTKEAE